MPRAMGRPMMGRNHGDLRMSAPLTAGQQASLREQLERRQTELLQRLAELQEGQSRVEHAHRVREQDADDVPQREGERGLDMTLTDLEVQELSNVTEALRRLDTERYGLCVDCEEPIPFGRLKVEPWALRCRDCQERIEQQRGLGA
jgi:DnaK suppressor protein